MPSYDYECLECGFIQEAFFHIHEAAEIMKCRRCQKGIAKKIISVGHGGIFLTEPKWLDDSIRSQLQRLHDSAEKPIETRQELKDHLNKNGIVPMD